MWQKVKDQNKDYDNWFFTEISLVSVYCEAAPYNPMKNVGLILEKWSFWEVSTEIRARNKIEHVCDNFG